MATPPERPWTTHEKNSLMAEIIKTANPPVNVLFSVIQSLQLQPRWDDIPLPPGRSLNSCRLAYDDVRRSLSAPMGAPLAPLNPTPMTAMTGSISTTLKRPFPYETAWLGSSTAGPTGGLTGREIRPKPSNPSAVPIQPSPTDQPTKKKRGRPTKAEALAKAEAAAASVPAFGEPGPVSMSRPASQSTPQPPPQPPPQPMTTMLSTARTDEPKPGLPPSLPPVTRMPIAAMLTPTAGEPHGGSLAHARPSSGRRRRARSTKSEQEEGESPPGRGNETGADYESPYARPDAPATPVKTAVLRHRGEEEEEEEEQDIPRALPMPGLAHDTSDPKLSSDTEQQQ